MTIHKDITLYEFFSAQAEEYLDNAIAYLKTIDWVKGGNDNVLKAIESVEKSKELAVAAIRSVKDIENVDHSDFQFRFSIMRCGF